MTMTIATPVKIVIERRALPGAEMALRSWAERLVAAAHRAPGHEGGSVLSSGGRSYVMLVRFASQRALDDWQRSAAYTTLMREADGISRGDDMHQVRSGLETWFVLPDMPPPAAPPAKWKIALLTWLALLPQVVALHFLLAPLRLPFFFDALVSTAIPVALLTWMVMPRLTRVVYRWLYA